MKQFVRSNDGLTLLEVMFSMSILAIVLLSLMITFPKMKMLVNKSQCKSAAIKACQATMEQIREAGVGSLVEGTSTDYSVILDHGADMDSTDDDIPAEVTTTIIDVGATAKKVTIQCTWIENNAECSEHLDCVLYNNVIG